MPDYKSYSLSELKEAYSFVDRDSYPDNFLSIVREIELREKECEVAYSHAISVLHGPGGEEEARPHFFDIALRFPGTAAGKKSTRFLKGEIHNLPPEFGTVLTGNELRLAFKGSEREYFRIWVVNLCLTLLTFGVFSAWAKVRRNRYIYSSITLDGTPFQYLGHPIPILKGRLLVFTFILLFFVLVKVYPHGVLYLLILGFLLAPYLFVKLVAFKARYLAYRNITFCFHGDLLNAFFVLLAWGGVPLLMLGVFFQWWGHMWIGVLLCLLSSLLFPIWLKEIKKFLFTNLSFSSVFVDFHGTAGEFFQIYFIGGVIAFITGLFFTFADANLVPLEPGSAKQLLLYVVTGASYLGYFLAFAYLKANITNAIWNRIRIGPLSFTCNLNALELFGVYVVNILGITCSLGFLMPWAEVRSLKYRIANIVVHYNGSMSIFSDEEHKKV